jgi:hypothetical protein
MAVDWVIARTFTDPDGVAITRYWSGGRNWHDEIKGNTARFTSPAAALERCEANVCATGKSWQGTISVVETPSLNVCEPTGKVKHPTRMHAERFLIQIWQDGSRRAQRNRRERRVYQCHHQEPGHAPHWHLTSKEHWDDVDPTQTSKVG